MIEPARWITENRGEWRTAVRHAAGFLLREYRTRWTHLVPIELNRLAASLGAKIIRVRSLPGHGRLIPADERFVVLVDAKLGYSSFRTTVAHELAHILFFDREAKEVRRREVLEKEEDFCFDVARHLLVPDWHLKQIRGRQISNVGELFSILTEEFRVSRPVAARVMLEDYALAEGIAGRWTKRNGEWSLDPGRAYASPSIASEMRKELHALAREWLASGTETVGDYRVAGIVEQSGQSAFVVVAQTTVATNRVVNGEDGQQSGSLR